MQIFLYDWWPLRRAGKLYEKMSRMHVEVKKRTSMSAVDPGLQANEDPNKSLRTLAAASTSAGLLELCQVNDDHAFGGGKGTSKD